MASYEHIDHMPKGADRFNSYFNAFDMFRPEYHTMMGTAPANTMINGEVIEREIDMSNLATTAHPGRDPLEQLSTLIKSGATALELGFTGQGKGNVAGGSTTPGSFGMEEREAIRMLAQENRVRLSTHATISLTGYAGLTRDQENYRWKFDENKRTEAEKEIEQTIDFAADAARGGAIVIHMGEFFRDIVTSPQNFEKGGPYFESYHGERDKIRELAEGTGNPEDLKDVHFHIGKVAREDTGELESIERDVPVLMKGELWGSLSQDLEEMGKRINAVKSGEEGIGLNWTQKEKEIERIKKEFSHKMNGEILNFDQIYEDKDKKVLRKGIYDAEDQNEKDASGISIGKGTPVQKISYAEVLRRVNYDYNEADKFFHKLRLVQGAGNLSTQIQQYRNQYDEVREDLEELKKVLEVQNEIKENTPLEEQWKLLRRTVRQRIGYDMGLMPEKYEMPTKFLDKQIRMKEEELKHLETNMVQSRQNLEMYNKQINLDVKGMEELGLKKTAQTVSDLGLHAMKRWNDLMQQNRDELIAQHSIKTEGRTQEEIDKELEDYALYIAPENMMPDFGAYGEPSYGGHPQELKEMILKSREAFKDKLLHPDKHKINPMQFGFDNSKQFTEEEAQKLADKHIKATFDIAHANVWRKFFRGDPNSTKSEDEQFRDWMQKEVQDLLDTGVIGHVHISDNFGYADDHISPGEGGSRGIPMASFTKQMLEAEDLGKKTKEPWIVEAGHQGFQILIDTWHNMGHPIYRVGPGIPGPSFGFMEQSYLTSSYSSRFFNDASLGPAQGRQVGWSGSPLI